jgi:hypothetical protein
MLRDTPLKYLIDIFTILGLPEVMIYCNKQLITYIADKLSISVPMRAKFIIKLILITY